MDSEEHPIYTKFSQVVPYILSNQSVIHMIIFGEGVIHSLKGLI